MTKIPSSVNGEEWNKGFVAGIQFSGVVAAQTHLWELVAAMQLGFRREKRSYLTHHKIFFD